METKFTGDNEEHFCTVFILQKQLSSTKLLEELKSENKNVNKLKLALYKNVTRNVNGKAWRHVCKQLLAVLTRQDTEPVLNICVQKLD